MDKLLIYLGMQKHHGQIVERVIRTNGFSITALAKGLNINRRSLYNWFQAETLKPDAIFAIGLIIKYDFSTDFPELFNTEHFRESDEHAYDAEEGSDNESYKEKYLKLLEDYNQLLLMAIEETGTDTNAGPKQ